MSSPRSFLVIRECGPERPGIEIFKGVKRPPQMANRPGSESSKRNVQVANWQGSETSMKAGCQWWESFVEEARFQRK